MAYFNPDALEIEVQHLYETGLPKGSGTGWRTLDAHYTVAMNQWTLVTGTPHAGKSEWLDALMVNLAKKDAWGFSIFSPENHPLSLHAAKILEKKIGKPFGTGPTERMTPAERDEGLVWLKRHFKFMQFDEPALKSILAEVSFSTNAKHGVIVDPWNTLEHHRPANYTTTEYISEQLSWIINFTRTHHAHFWLVAHPKKPEKDQAGKAPTPYQISDSAHFYNKADNIITVHRNQHDEDQRVEIHVQKCRFKHIGRIGMVPLMYDRITGRYHEPLTAPSVANYYNK